MHDFCTMSLLFCYDFRKSCTLKRIEDKKTLTFYPLPFLTNWRQKHQSLIKKNMQTLIVNRSQRTKNNSVSEKSLICAFIFLNAEKTIPTKGELQLLDILLTIFPRDIEREWFFSSPENTILSSPWWSIQHPHSFDKKQRPCLLLLFPSWTSHLPGCHVA